MFPFDDAIMLKYKPVADKPSLSIQNGFIESRLFSIEIDLTIFFNKLNLSLKNRFIELKLVYQFNTRFKVVKPIHEIIGQIPCLDMTTISSCHTAKYETTGSLYTLMWYSETCL